MSIEYKALPGWPEQPPGIASFAADLPASELPRISIVCPSFQQGAFIEDFIRSVVFQRYPNVELVIIDGGSSDETTEILKKYSQFIDYWISEPDEGQSDALNKGLDIATGDLVGWQNADDFYLPNAFWHVAQRALQVPALSSSVFLGHIAVVEDSRVIGRKYFCRFSRDSLIYRGINFATQALFFGHEIAKTHRIDRSLTYAMDGEFILSISRAGFPFYLVNKFLGAYRRHEDAKTIAHSEDSRAEWHSVLRREGIELKNHRWKKHVFTIRRLFELAQSGNLVQATVEKLSRTSRRP
ncbi:glycosyltransferase [Roseiconus nitratireducens]|uniref:Glycosyltransferase n=1 Tax=Roseiconus nitratireducens TaxID=2605748 RepID=A0A5M6CUG2_9BACT|nr:glycosyltransferase family 2 protein [Roseiconus nitratireducens]KAA5538898.1 glycosyltransferase [Roseiconus nitratireducens]